MASHALQLVRRRLFFPQGGLASVPGGFLPSSAALSAAPCQGSLGPSWPGACCSCSTKGALPPRSGGKEACFAARLVLTLSRSVTSVLNTERAPRAEVPIPLSAKPRSPVQEVHWPDQPVRSRDHVVRSTMVTVPSGRSHLSSLLRSAFRHARCRSLSSEENRLNTYNLKLAQNM